MKEDRLTIYFTSRERLELIGGGATDFLREYYLMPHHDGLPIQVKEAEGTHDGEPYEVMWLIDRRNIERVHVTAYPQTKNPQ